MHGPCINDESIHNTTRGRVIVIADCCAEILRKHQNSSFAGTDTGHTEARNDNNGNSDNSTQWNANRRYAQRATNTEQNALQLRI